jgi:hypothetical protein
MKKELLKSKTIWTSILVAVSGLFPPIQALIIANPDIASCIIGGVFGLLRVEHELKDKK